MTSSAPDATTHDAATLDAVTLDAATRDAVGDIALQAAKADLFRRLHTDGPPLALANAWDVASAVVVQSAGAPAVATTSAGVAWSLGIPDGNVLSRDLAVALVARVARVVQVPVTADIEGGFADDAAGVGETIRRILEAGAVGVNLEDVARDADNQLRDPDEQAERIASARRAADAYGVGLFINARIDTYLRGIGDPDTRHDETRSRAGRYLEAGADGIFVPGVVDPETIQALVAAIPAPLNILVGPGAPTVGELGDLGVRRASLGSSVAAAAYAVAEQAARELAATGTYDSVRAELDYGRLNGLVG
jgi:2-methylisocitrate lyase-like PEP mutase family enzyme